MVPISDASNETRFCKTATNKEHHFPFCHCSNISKQMAISTWLLVTQQFPKHHFNSHMIPIQTA